jgi:hypothetical protein
LRRFIHVSGTRLYETFSLEMSHETYNRTFFASAVVMALSAVAYAQAGGGAGGTPTPAGSMKAPIETGYGSPGVPGTDVGAATSVDAARNGPTTNRSNSGKTNGLNKGTHSGANSDVNSGPGGSMQNGK